MKLSRLKFRFPRLTVAVQFTKEGLVFVFLTLAIGAAAVNTGNNVLYLIFSIMLSLIVVSGLISRRILSGLSPRIDFPPYLFSGTPGVCYLSLENRKRGFPSIGIRLASPEGSIPKISRFFFYIPSNNPVNDFVTLVFPKRGIYQIHELELQTRFPFCFFLKIRRHFLNESIRVYPQVYRLPEELLARIAEGTVLESPYRGESHQLLHLRDYNLFDPSKRIHWKASAKAEKLFVKEFQKDQGRDLRIYFDCYAAEDSGSEVMEKGISLVASFAFLAAEKGLDADFVFVDRSFGIWDGNHAILKLLDHLSELKIGRPSIGDTPADPSISRNDFKHDLLSVRVCSRIIPSVFSLNPGNVRSLFVEDWESLLTTTETPAALKSVV
jgi:uncharacterized protein (DUF58 family)